MFYTQVKYAKTTLILAVIFALLFSCKKKKNQNISSPINTNEQIKALDFSEFPEISTYGLIFKNKIGVAEDPLVTLKKNGVNTIRLRLWYNPTTQYSGYHSVKAFAAELKAKGFKILLSVHYSDTWTDPGQQATPAIWTGLNFTTLKDSVNAYTKRIVQEMNPEYIQIGNEINSGFLFPNGSIANRTQFLQLLQSAITSVRTFAPATKIIIHYAGLSGADSFYTLLGNLDYDIIGISYYPVFHSASVENLESVLNNMATQFQKKIMLAETAYPFTLGWSDFTNNIVGLPSQLLSGYPASNDGQKNFLIAISNLKNKVASFTGFSYWGAALVAFKGPTATNGSPWENQALWDFNFQVVPAMDVFKNF